MLEMLKYFAITQANTYITIVKTIAKEEISQYATFLCSLRVFRCSNAPDKAKTSSASRSKDMEDLPTCTVFVHNYMLACLRVCECFHACVCVYLYVTSKVLAAKWNVFRDLPSFSYKHLHP